MDLQQASAQAYDQPAPTHDRLVASLPQPVYFIRELVSPLTMAWFKYDVNTAVNT